MITKSMLGTIRHAWSEDPAIDKSDPDKFAMAWKEALRTGDIKCLPFREGDQPAVFELAPLTRKQFLRVFAQEGISQVCEAVAYGLRTVSGFIVDGRGVDLDRVDSDAGKRLSAASLDALFDPVLFMELGTRIIEVSRIDPLRSQG